MSSDDDGGDSMVVDTTPSTPPSASTTTIQPPINHDEKNLRHFRIPASSGGNSPLAKQPTSTTSAGVSPSRPGTTGMCSTSHQLAVRFKAVVKDISEMALANRDESMCDYFITLADEATKAFRGAKSDIRVQHRSPGLIRAKPQPPPAPSVLPSYSQHMQQEQQQVHVDPSSNNVDMMMDNDITPPRRSDSPLQRRSYAAILGVDALPQQPPLGGDKDAAAARQEERRAEAEGRRKLLASERHRKFEEQAERTAAVKVRREQVLERTRAETREKAERAERLRAEASHRKKEFSSRDLERVDEVNVINAINRDTKVVELEVRQQQQNETVEQKRRNDAAVARERAEAHEAVIAHARDIENAKREKQEQKLAHKEEAAKRHEEQRKLDNEARKQRHEDRERRVVEEKARADAEAEAKHRDSMKKLEESAVRRKERLEEKNRVRQEKAEQLVQHQLVSAALGDDDQPQHGGDDDDDHDDQLQSASSSSSSPQSAAVAAAASVTELSVEEDHFSSRLANVVQRHGKMFLENFAKEHSHQVFNIKCRFNVVLDKFSRPGDVLTRQTAAELGRALSATAKISEQQDDLDHATLRQHQPSVFEVLSSSIADQRRKLQQSHGVPHGHHIDPILQRAPYELLHRLMLHPREGPKHVAFFCKSGLFVPLATAVFHELRAVPKKATTMLRDQLSLFQLCAHFFIVEDEKARASQAFRLIMSEFLKLSEPEKVVAALIEQQASSVAAAAASSDDNNNSNSKAASSMDVLTLEVVQFLLMLFQLRLRCMRESSGGNGSSPQQLQTDEDATSKYLHLLLTWMTSVLMPRGQLCASMPNVGTLVLFTLLRLLNDVTRKNLSAAQRALSEPASRQIVFHALSVFCQYIMQQGEAELESIENPGPDEVKSTSFDPGALSPTFLSAVEFGVTFTTAQRPPLVLSSEIVVGSGATAAKATPGADVCEPRLRSALHEVLLFVGYVALNNPVMQDVFHYGMGSSLLLQLLECCPITYFGVGQHVLFPTLLCICFKNRRNLSVLSQETDLVNIAEFLSAEIAARPSANRRQKKNDAAAAASGQPQVTPRVTSDKWAEIEDDDEDEDEEDEEQQQQQQQQAATTDPQNSARSAKTASSGGRTPASVEDYTVVSARKDKLTQSIATTTNKYSQLHMFRLDKRFPLSLWSDALFELRQQLGQNTPTAP